MRAAITIGDVTTELAPGQLSDWIRLTFRAVPGVNVSGMTRIQVLEMGEHFSLYVSPINLDPERPAMPISHPSYYATYLAKRIGPYSTLGLAEDTWALNEGVTSERTFLQQTYDIDRERRTDVFCRARSAAPRLARMRVRRDRSDSAHVLAVSRCASSGGRSDRPSIAMPSRISTKAMTRSSARSSQRLGDGDLLMVISDHGFSSFRRGVNLNAWLQREGYLTLNQGTTGAAEWLRDVDWSRTRAYCLGLTGLFLNIRGREQRGIVAPGADAERVEERDSIQAEQSARP